MSRRPLWALAFVGLLLGGVTGCPPALPMAAPNAAPNKASGLFAPVSAKKPQGDEAAVHHLLGLMRERLLIMNEVARSKWAFKRAVADPGRERSMLDDLAIRGQSVGLKPEQTKRFFSAQVEASKLIQQHHYDQWQVNRAGPMVETVMDLNDLRQKIDKLNQDLLKALADALPWLEKESGWEKLMQWSTRLVAGEGIDDRVRSTAVAPLMEKKSDMPPGF